MTANPPPEIAALRESLPLALKRQQVVRLFRHCGIGGIDEYNKFKASGTLVPLRGLTGAKQARFSREQVLTMCEEALNESPSS